jgi:hypothetical protein
MEEDRSKELWCFGFYWFFNFDDEFSDKNDEKINGKCETQKFYKRKNY